MNRLLFLGTLLTAAAAARADDLRVPQDFGNLRQALIAAQTGDRIVVTGGTWHNGRITADGVSIVGKGTVLTGTWEMPAANAAIEGCTFRDFDLKITGDGAALRNDRFFGPYHANGAIRAFVQADD